MTTFVCHFCSKKNAQIVNLKLPDLDLIRRIHGGCGFYGFMILFWICPQKWKIRFWIRKSGFGFSQKTHPFSLYLKCASWKLRSDLSLLLYWIPRIRKHERFGQLWVELVSQKESNQFNIQTCLHAQYTFFIMKVFFFSWVKTAVTVTGFNFFFL